jgi:hypothetical protein
MFDFDWMWFIRLIDLLMSLVCLLFECANFPCLIFPVSTETAVICRSELNPITLRSLAELSFVSYPPIFCQ